MEELSRRKERVGSSQPSEVPTDLHLQHLLFPGFSKYPSPSLDKGLFPLLHSGSLPEHKHASSIKASLLLGLSESGQWTASLPVAQN